MKLAVFFVFACGVLSAQANAPAPSLPDLPDNTVIATFDDGGKFTMRDLRNLFAILPSANQQALLRDRKNFLEQYAFLRKLAKMAEADKLDQTSPNKEALEYNRMILLYQMKLTDENQKTIISEDDVRKFYESNPNQYRQVRVKAIYIAFTKAQASQSSNGKRLLTEDEARAKAEKLVADLRAGADFGKLARENSDDPASRDKDGDFATFHPSDTIPEPIKAAVFSLKQGEVTLPVEQPNGFYVFRAEEISTRPLAEVHGDIYTSLQQEHSRKWMEATHDSVKIQFNPEFLSSEKAAAPAK
ncbi:MAG TPA: peptidylprolyl isomerase [Bryobacteraceae bacterium]|nr:peptidylprolyl isomerase [Bryobacteraceae bacterium]